MKLKSIVLGFCILVGVSCGRKENTYQNITRPVRVVKVESLGAMERVYTGIVEAEEYSKLAFKVSGPLIEMNVDAGQKVKKGTVIAVVDPLDYDLQYEANKAAYITAKSQMDRNKKLLAMQAISKQDYEIAEANFVKANSAYENSQNTLNDTKLRAPFDGFVEEKYVENYQKVQQGEPIIKLVNPDKLEVSFILPETNVGLTRTKMDVAIEFDTYKGKWFQAKVKEFVDASPDGSGIPVKLAIVDSSFNRNKYNIYPGFSCKVILRIDNMIANSYVIPLSAVFKDLKTEETSVWLYDAAGSSVKRQKIDATQLTGSDNVVVASGLESEDVIVVAGVNYITEGQKVNILN